VKLAGPITLAAVALLAAGCGSSEPSNAGYAAKADAVCASLNATDAKLSPSGSVAAVKSEEAALATAIDKLQGLSAPYNEGAQFADFIYELQQEQPLLRKQAVATAAHDAPSIASVEAQLRGVEPNVKSSAVNAGLSGCS
jgi:hypothetical protein